jgi:hypothetical protein
MDADLAKLTHRESKTANRIVVPATLRNPHPLVARTLSALEMEIPDDAQHLGRSYATETEPCLRTSVSPPLIARTMRIANALVHAVEKRGGIWRTEMKSRVLRPTKNDEDYSLDFLGERFDLVLREKVKRVPTPQEEFDRWRAGPYRSINQPPKFRDEPTGILLIEVIVFFEPVVIGTDTTGAPLEDHLNDVIIGLIKAVHRRRTRRTKDGQKEERRRAEEARQKEIQFAAESEQRRLAAEAKAVRDRISDLQFKAAAWGDARTFRAFAEEVRTEAIRRHGNLDEFDGLVRWLEWVDEYARSIDPLEPSHELPSLDGAEDSG